MILFLGNKVFIRPFTSNISFYPYIVLALMPVLFTSVYGLMQKILIIEGNAWHYSVNTLGFFLSNTILCLLFIVCYKFGAVGFLLASAISNLIYFIYSMVFLISRMSLSFDKQICDFLDQLFSW